MPVKQVVGSSSLPRGATKLPRVSEGVLKALWSIRNLSKNTQRTYSKNLRRLAREADLNDTREVEAFVFDLDVSNSYRNALFDAYSHYCKANEIDWNRPKVKEESKPIKIPTEENIDKIISSATQKYSTVFHLSKHGLRPDEISKIRLRDLDLKKGTLEVRTSKMGKSRTLKLSTETVDLLREFVNNNEFTDIDKELFASSKTIRGTWRKYRKRAFNKFKDAELLKIRLYDLRHWFGTMTYIKTRDIFHVKYQMGHRNIESTLHYMHVAKGLQDYSDEYTVKVALSLEEFTNLLENGFEYISDYYDNKILRKRK
ncbi:tyrosine-type recombinase/integrase [Candidatus Bathyarchaeota archaeon]|nr:tyrosine-type recombinase/integrase [Candidatus Bathyarchaeota archaeon]